MTAATTSRTVPVTAILDRAGAEVRPLDPGHVVTVAESIGVLGLLQPIAVDRSLRVLGGAHRRVACLLLIEADPARRRRAFLARFKDAEADLADRVVALDRTGWLARHPGGVVQVAVLDIDSTRESDTALLVQSAENAARRAFSKAEVESIVERLRKAGYTDRRGRPRKGEKPLRPALSRIVGLSERQLVRIFASKIQHAQRERAAGDRRRGRVERGSWARVVGRLRAAVASCRAAARHRRDAAAQRLARALAGVERALRPV